MSDIYENEVMDEVTEIENDGEGRDLSTVVGVGLIAGAGVVAYEGGKRIVKFVGPKVKAGWRKLRGKTEESADGETPPPAENVTPPPEK